MSILLDQTNRVLVMGVLVRGVIVLSTRQYFERSG